MRRLVGVILVAGLVACAPAQTEPANLEQIPTAQIAANRKLFLGAPKARAKSKTSGGIGKTDDSTRAIKNRAHNP